MTGKEFVEYIIRGDIKVKRGDAVLIEDTKGLFTRYTQRIQRRLGYKYWRVGHLFVIVKGDDILESHVSGVRYVDLGYYNSDRFNVIGIARVKNVTKKERCEAVLSMSKYIRERYDFWGILGLLLRHTHLYTKKIIKSFIRWINMRGKVFCSELWIKGWKEVGVDLGVKSWGTFPGQIPELKRIKFIEL